jgi:hypothetical protein
MFAVEPKDGRVFTPKTLAVVEEITQVFWKIPYSLRVDPITNFQYNWSEGDDLVVQGLIGNAESFTDEQLKKVQAVALAEPLLRNRLITKKSDITGINVTSNIPHKSISETPEVVAFVREMQDKFEKKYPSIKIYLTGFVFMDNAFNEAGERYEVSRTCHVLHRSYHNGLNPANLLGDSRYRTDHGIFDFDWYGPCGLVRNTFDSHLRQCTHYHSHPGGGRQYSYSRHLVL